MNVGMLWFDNDTKAELAQRVQRAMAYYRKKYGKKPTLCYVHPSMLPQSDKQPLEEKRITINGLVLHGDQCVLPNHFWLGVNGEGNSEASPG